MKKITILFSLTFLFAWGATQAQNCQADFQYYTSQNSLTVQFQDSSTVNGSAGVAYMWGFGDGNGDYTPNPTHTYAQAGTYNVCLGVYDSLLNCYDSTCYNVTVNLQQPPANCNASYTIAKDSSVQFGVILYNTSTNAPSHTYQWDFGDGTTGSGRTPQHQYQNFGSYVVCLTITDPQLSCTTTFCDTVGMDSTGNLKSPGFGLDVRNPLATSIKEESNTLQNLSIYPNPAKSNLTIDLSGLEGQVQMKLIDISGKTIYETPSVIGGSIEQVDLEQYDNGFYLLILNDNQNRRVEKVVISK
jgi:PKD repeat protein